MIVFGALRVTPQSPCDCQAGDPSQTQPCGNCGTQTRQCDGCRWPDWSTVACEGQGHCATGTVEQDATGCTKGKVR
jgi:hypothetical protein